VACQIASWLAWYWTEVLNLSQKPRKPEASFYTSVPKGLDCRSSAKCVYQVFVIWSSYHLLQVRNLPVSLGPLHHNPPMIRNSEVRRDFFNVNLLNMKINCPTHEACGNAIHSAHHTSSSPFPHPPPLAPRGMLIFCSHHCEVQIQPLAKSPVAMSLLGFRGLWPLLAVKSATIDSCAHFATKIWKR